MLCSMDGLAAVRLHMHLPGSAPDHTVTVACDGAMHCLQAAHERLLCHTSSSTLAYLSCVCVTPRKHSPSKANDRLRPTISQGMPCDWNSQRTLLQYTEQDAAARVHPVWLHAVSAVTSYRMRLRKELLCMQETATPNDSPSSRHMKTASHWQSWQDHRRPHAHAHINGFDGSPKPRPQ